MYFNDMTYIHINGVYQCEEITRLLGENYSAISSAASTETGNAVAVVYHQYCCQALDV